MPDNHAVLYGLIVAGFFGAFIGSFLNVCIHRLPRNESVVKPGSRCYSCGTHVQWYDNIPILSYLMLRGRCRWCGSRFSYRYMLMELLVALISMLAFWWCWQQMQSSGLNVFKIFTYDFHNGIIGDILLYASVLTLLYYIFVSSVIDIDHRIIPDELSKGFQFLAPALACALPFFLVNNGAFIISTAPTIVVSGLAIPESGGLSDVPELHGAQPVFNIAYGIEQIWFSTTVYYIIAAGLITSFIMALPIANRVYTTVVPVDQRWKPEDARAYRSGLWVFLSSIACYMLILVVLQLSLPDAVDGPGVSWHILRWTLMEAILGSLIGWALPFYVGILGSWVFKRGAMGYGDVKFLAPIGAFVGPIGVIETFFLAALIGTAIGVPALLFRRQLEIPFGPYLAAGAVVTLLWGSQIAGLMLPGFFL